MTMEEIVTRQQWGAAAPTQALVPLNKAVHECYYTHWLGEGYPAQMTDEQVLQSVQRFHQRTRGWGDIGYNYAIGRSARIFEGRGLHIGAQAEKQNSRSIGVVFLVGVGEAVTPEMLASFVRLVDYLRSQGWTRDGRVVVLPHHDSPTASTACSGPQLIAWSRAFTFARDAAAYLSSTPTTQEVRMSPNEPTIRSYYTRILGWEGDPEGVAYWTKVLDEKRLTPTQVQVEFLIVAAGADRAATAAQIKSLASGVSTANLDGTLAGAADVARTVFYEELAKLAARGQA